MAYYSSFKRKDISHAINVYEPLGHYSKQNKAVTEGQTLYNSLI